VPTACRVTSTHPRSRVTRRAIEFLKQVGPGETVDLLVSQEPTLLHTKRSLRHTAL